MSLGLCCRTSNYFQASKENGATLLRVTAMVSARTAWFGNLKPEHDAQSNGDFLAAIGDGAGSDVPLVIQGG
ncbi:MAG: hypothetical protein RI953_1131 [Pseudomonadota bacterium]